MKRFNLDEYLNKKLAGEKVELITKIGEPVRILCTDFKDSYRIIAAINIGQCETLYHYTDDGRTYESEWSDARDLFFATDTKEGWINMYKSCNPDKPKVKRFGLKTLRPFDKILVRDKNTQRWSIDLYSFYDIDFGCGEFPIVTSVARYRYAIPYNKDTEHLVGTTNDCPDFYKWWEE